jgi:hypothetical protein
MDKDDMIRDLDRTLRIRALFDFERAMSTAEEEEQEFLREAVDLLRRQPGLAACIDVPEELLLGSLGDS